MKQKLTLTDKSFKLISDLNATSSQDEKLKITSAFYDEAVKIGYIDAEELLKSKTRESVTKWVVRWFYGTNAVTLIIILAILVKEMFFGKMDTSVINPSVILALIAGSVTQNAAAFLLIAKYLYPAKNTEKV